MLFTVVQYVPVLEEEAPHAKVDFSKKIKDTSEGDGGEDSTPDSDADSMTSEGIVSGFNINWALAVSSVNIYRTNPDFYSSLPGNINTPPPKI